MSNKSINFHLYDLFIQKKDMFMGLVIIFLILIFYSNTFDSPFIFDDTINILENPSIRNIWPIWNPFYVSSGTGIAGRPVVNFTLALNYAISGENVWSYHVFNLIIHMLSALTLWKIIERTLLTDRLNRFKHIASPLSFAAAVLWAIHPIQTQAVTYTIQRCESLMGLFFLLTFYCAIRGWQSRDNLKFWHLWAILFFLLGIGTKEVIIAVIPLIFLYQWVFSSDITWNTLKDSWILYGGLLLGLLALSLLLIGGGTTSSGTSNHSFSYIHYILTQPRVILHYVYLTFFPFSLCLDYGQYFDTPGGYAYLIIILALIIVSLWLLKKRNAFGFLMAWFFLILAPTSLYPLPDVAFEHRMYLPSMALIILSVLSVYYLTTYITGKLYKSSSPQNLPVKNIYIYLFLFFILFLGILTFGRNLDYKKDIFIWEDTVNKMPQNVTALTNLGSALIGAGKSQVALIHLHRAEIILSDTTLNVDRRKSTLTNLYNNIGFAYLNINQWQKAEHYFRLTLQQMPQNTKALSGLGIALSLQHKYEDALSYLKEAIAIDKDFADAYVNCGVVFRLQNKLPEALKYYQKAMEIKPHDPNAIYGTAMTYFQLKDYDKARQYFQNLIALKPQHPQALEILKIIGNNKP